MKWGKKIALAAGITLPAIGLGAKEVKADPFPGQPLQVSHLDQQAMDYLYGLRLPMIIDSLNERITIYKKMLQSAENRYPDLTFISRILSQSGVAMDRIGDQSTLITGVTSTPTTAIVSVMDILDINSSGVVQGVKLRPEYRKKAVWLFGETEVCELENALSKLFTNTMDEYRVDYISPGGTSKGQSSSTVPKWLDALDGKYVYMLVKIVMLVNGIKPEDVAAYSKDLDTAYKEILWLMFQINCATKAKSLAEWLSEHGADPNIPYEIKMQKYDELKILLKQLGIYI
ncbi:MAG: hypothetical protein QXY61_03650 [Candidatus Anstonellales archaeon]